MDNTELKKKKDELMKENWTESLHLGLEKLEPNEAKWIVDSMTEEEIYIKVNFRRFQQSYIADYLNFLWDISKNSFWNHVKLTLDLEYGILWGEDMSYFKILLTEKIPIDVLKVVLNYAINCDENNDLDIDAIGCIIKSQVEKFNRLEEIEKFISHLKDDLKLIADKRIHKMINSDCPYTF